MSEVQQQQEKTAQHVVTSENLLDFQLNRMGIKQEEQKQEEKPAEVEEKAEEKPIEQPVEGDQVDEIPPDGTIEGSKVVFRGKWVPKTDYGYRMHLKTEQVKAEKLRADAAEAKLRELEDKKAAPEKPIDPDAEPNPADYQDAFKYAKDLAQWAHREAVKKERERAAKEKEEAEQQQVIKAWEGKVSAAKTAYEDYEEVLLNTTINLSDFSAPMQAAIMESDVGPHLLYYYASNPEEVHKLKSMSLPSALRSMGKLETRFEKQEEKQEKPKAVVSKAPAPIAPIKGGTQTAPQFDENGNWTGTAKEYKEMRKAGKIK